ncbi:hypothetical protein VNO78_33301 [Psophocarpus tetragonolobus]|uniref:Uncharacterized protein n=1 Tax=Psophocarpus tetragonolobus TaxID=3891 RepID=A0AAN9P0W4_PSOTE
MSEGSGTEPLLGFLSLLDNAEFERMLENPFKDLDEGAMTGNARGGAMRDNVMVGASRASRVFGKLRGTPGHRQGHVHLTEDKWCTTFIKSKWPASTTIVSRPRLRLCGMRI